MEPGTQKVDVFNEVLGALHGSGQQTADEVANTVRNGCFEHCDGYPETLISLTGEILREVVSLGTQGEIDIATKNTLMEMARSYAEIDGKVQTVCRAECPTGAYGLFEKDDDLFDENDDPVIRPCPIKGRLAEIAIAFERKG